MWRLVGAFSEALFRYLEIAWWGLVSPRVSEREPLAVAQAVILGDEGILLSIRSDLQGWELPGGTLEQGERFEEALLREVREETGLEVEVVRHTGDYVRTGFRPHTAHVYRCRPVAGTLQMSSESLALQWFSEDEIPDTLFPWYRQPLEDALSDRREPVSRSERQGVSAILAGMRIDLRMRFSRHSPVARHRRS
jgi:8-oxo-dGTP diphosphatase